VKALSRKLHTHVKKGPEQEGGEEPIADEALSNMEVPANLVEHALELIQRHFQNLDTVRGIYLEVREAFFNAELQALRERTAKAGGTTTVGRTTRVRRTITVRRTTTYRWDRAGHAHLMDAPGRYGAANMNRSPSSSQKSTACELLELGGRDFCNPGCTRWVGGVVGQ
jgi:hypothetical protein